MDQYKAFQEDLEHLINKHSMEKGSNTPDFILARYLTECLAAFDLAQVHRQNWYGGTLEKHAGTAGEPQKGN